jgi:hypothetical protein
MSCICEEGVYGEGGAECLACDPACLICNTFLNVDCDICSPGYYKSYQSQCSSTCPPFFEKNDE